jgi:drug/metabolite transporter (DMT)-like permease
MPLWHMARMLLLASLRSRQIGLLHLLVASVGWGLNWPALKVLLREWPPLSARGFAGVAAALGLALLARMSGERLAVPRRSIARLVAAAMTNVFVWMGFSTVAMLWLNVGEAALLVYTMPIWVMILSWPLRGDRPTASSIVALVMGIAGIAVLLGGPGFAFGPGKVAGALLALAAAFLFALGTVASRSPLGLPPLASVAWQVGIGCLPMVVAGLVFEQPELSALSPAGWALMAYMAAVPMGICYLSWFAALRSLPPSTASIGTLLVPVIGIVTAAFILDEPFGAKELLALVLTLGGVALALRKA